MLSMPTFRQAALVFLLLSLFAAPAGFAKLTLPPETPAILDQIYSFDIQGAMEAAKRMEQERPAHPLGYLLEAEALWWRMWCASADFKYGMTDARRRAKYAADQHYFELAAKASSLADAHSKRRENVEMQFYAGMAYAAAARLYALRGENRNAARAGVRARDLFTRPKILVASPPDASRGIVLYYYDGATPSAVARVLRFFVGIP